MGKVAEKGTGVAGGKLPSQNPAVQNNNNTHTETSK